MMRVNWTRFIISLLLIVGVQYAVSYLLFYLGVGGIWAIVIMSFAMGILFAYLNFPKPFRKGAIRNPQFHKNIAIFFVIFFILNILF